ncbi:hypothetical protein Sste5346_001057 [Sporothrix stenoceras]|uniref:MT-A70-domain-containing protein n=1 Tax=Sporothrix stenoceras TaxID=5173 RepID=A0ABR3ZQC7_9PEZI
MSRPPDSAPSSSILFENADSTVVVVDLPRSIEEAQGVREGDDNDVNTLKTRRRLISAPALTEPFPTPRGTDAIDYAAGRSLAAQLAELTTQAAVEGALDELKTVGFDGPWCVPRCFQEDRGENGPSQEDECSNVLIPPRARYLNGTIADYRDEFLAEAPDFDLIALDPPWPNRSARRRRQGRKRKSSALDCGDRADTSGSSSTKSADSGYETAFDMESLRETLEQIPVGAKLANDGIVAVWVTNKPACEAVLTDPKNGLFRAWGVELVATWTWIKVTSRGEPVVAVDAQWRKPWERLLLARRASASSDLKTALPASRVIVGVPDVHSRKPHLKPLLAPFLSSAVLANQDIRGLEVFARNLTAGWWSWGNEVLLFQHPYWWAADIKQQEMAANVDTVDNQG